MDRVLVRLSDELDVDIAFVDEAINTVSDRLLIRLGTESMPKVFESIVVDAVVKMYRRQYHEGIESEQIDTINTTFVNNILDEYELEIRTYVEDEKDRNRERIRFI